MKRIITLLVEVELQDHAIAGVLQRETGKDLRLHSEHVGRMAKTYLESVLSHVHVGPAPVVKVAADERGVL